MARSVADQVYARVEEITAASGTPTRAQAIRRVAEEMGRSVSATSSAYYAGARRAREEAEAGTVPAPAGRRRQRPAGGPDAARLYAEMLPLVEAGATVEQAARRFGDEDSVEEIALGFSRWLARQGEDGDGEAADAEARVADLEAEVGALREEVARLRRAVESARAALDEAG